MAKRRTKGQVERVQYWMHETLGKMAISRGKTAAKDFTERGFREVGPQTFARAAKAAQAAKQAAQDDDMAARAGMV